MNTQAAPAVSQPTEEQSKATSGFEPLPTAPPLPTQSGLASASPAPTLPAVLPTEPAKAEMHIVQVEWPLQMRMGESDIARLALVPSSQGYTLVTEYPEHQIVTQTVAVRQTSGYELFAVARLDGVGFDISPSGEQTQYLPNGEGLSWRWSLTPRQPGRQRLSITLILRWVPMSGSGSPNREMIAFSRSLDVRVLSFFGLTQAQALLTGLITLLLGGGLSLFAVVVRPRAPQPTPGFDLQPPNPSLAIELPAGLRLASPETSSITGALSALRTTGDPTGIPFRIFRRAHLPGVAHPTRWACGCLYDHQNWRAASYAARIPQLRDFCKRHSAPITARIQRPPVSTSTTRSSHLAALQYTFIGEPGHPPNSLRQALLSRPDPRLLFRLLDTFGPNWWLQRRPYTFRMATEYDRVLPTHLVLEPAYWKRPGVGRTAIPRQPGYPGRRASHPAQFLAGRATPGWCEFLRSRSWLSWSAAITHPLARSRSDRKAQPVK